MLRAELIQQHETRALTSHAGLYLQHPRIQVCGTVGAWALHVLSAWQAAPGDYTMLARWKMDPDPGTALAWH